MLLGEELTTFVLQLRGGLLRGALGPHVCVTHSTAPGDGAGGALDGARYSQTRSNPALLHTAQGNRKGSGA